MQLKSKLSPSGKPSPGTAGLLLKSNDRLRMNGGQRRSGESNQNGRLKEFVPISPFLSIQMEEEMTCGQSVRRKIGQRKDQSIVIRP